MEEKPVNISWGEGWWLRRHPIPFRRTHIACAATPRVNSRTKLKFYDIDAENIMVVFVALNNGNIPVKVFKMVSDCYEKANLIMPSLNSKWVVYNILPDMKHQSFIAFYFRSRAYSEERISGMLDPLIVLVVTKQGI
jgi:hypothetical protein